jgi:hypothetical protein
LLAGFDPAKYDATGPIGAYSGIVAANKGDDVPNSVRPTPALHIGPRFGFALDLTGQGNTILRGGFGAFFYRDAAWFSYNTMLNPPLFRSVTFQDTGHSLADFDYLDPDIVKQDIYVLDPADNRLPTTHSWNMTLSQRLPKGIIVETSYVGNSSHNQLTVNHNTNRVAEGAMFGFPKGTDPNDYRPFQSYGKINLVSDLLTQNYNSLQVSCTRQTGRINFMGSYTFAKALGISAFLWGAIDSFDLRGRSYGVLESDRTHTFSIAYSVLLPSPARSRYLREVVNGWQISGFTQVQSGPPFRTHISMFGTMANGDPIENPINVGGTPDTWSNPQLTCDPRKGLGENQYANVNCFAAPTPGHNGPYQLPYLKQPSFQNHDLSLFKNFALSSKSETRKLQLRFSAYNFLNHPNRILKDLTSDLNLNFINGLLAQDSVERFGRSSEKSGRRVIQLAIKFVF